jgi:hypothetical protein
MEHEWECVLVLEDHGRTVYSVTRVIRKPDTTQTGCESLGWIASTGGDGRINVWAFGVSRHYVTLCASQDVDRCDPRNHQFLHKEDLPRIG